MARRPGRRMVSRAGEVRTRPGRCATGYPGTGSAASAASRRAGRWARGSACTGTHCPPVRGLRRDVTAREAAQDLLIRRLGILLALLAGERTGPSEQQPGGELGRRPVPLPGVVLEPIRVQDAQVRCPDLPEPLDQGGVGLVGGVDLNRDEVLGDGGDDRRLAVADPGQRCAAASSGGEEVHQDQRAGCPGLLAGGVYVSGPPPDRFHSCRLRARGWNMGTSSAIVDERRPEGEPRLPPIRRPGGPVVGWCSPGSAVCRRSREEC